LGGAESRAEVAPPSIRLLFFVAPLVALLSMRRLLIGYAAAAEFTGIPARRLKRMVESRQIRVIKPSKRSVLFDPEHLAKDIMAMEQPTIYEPRHRRS
jgi:hypothetical protein